MARTARKIYRLALPSSLALAGLVGSALCAATPALADLPRDQEERGFYIELEGTRVRPSNLDFLLATNNAGGEGVRLEFGRSAEFRYQVGWLLPERKGSVAITYWEAVEQQFGGGTRPTSELDPTAFLAVSSPRDRVEAVASFLARSVDVTYGRDFNADDRFRASWSVGLRYSRYEHRLKARYFESFLKDIAFEQVEATGVGPRVGASFEYSFTSRWSLGGGAALATLFGDADHGNVSVTEISATPCELTMPPFTPPCRLVSFTEQRNQSRTFSQLDLDLHVVYVAWKTLQITGGYRIFHWYDARSRELFAGSQEVERVTFDGPYLSVRYRF